MSGSLNRKCWGVFFVATLLVSATAWGAEIESSDIVSAPTAETQIETEEVEPVFNSTPPEQVFFQSVTATPEWTVSAGAIFLTRGKGDDSVLVRNGFVNPNGAVIFSAGDFDFDYQTGYNIDVTRHCEDYDIHFNHFAVDGWNATQTFTGGTETFAYHAPGALLTPGDFIRMTYSSDIASAEINWKPHTDSFITPFIGLRWLELNERLHQETGFMGVVNSAFNVDTHNDLYGIQVGADLQLVESTYFELMGTGKFVVAGNASRNQIRSFVGGTTFPQLESSTTKIAFIYDFAVKGKVHLSDHVALTGGYSLIILSQVALAPGQLEQNQISTVRPGAGNKHIDHGDFLIIHGANTNLEITW